MKDLEKNKFLFIAAVGFAVICIVASIFAVQSKISERKHLMSLANVSGSPLPAFDVGFRTVEWIGECETIKMDYPTYVYMECLGFKEELQ